MERAMGPGLRPDSAADNVGDLNKSLKQLCLSFLIYKSPCLRRSMRRTGAAQGLTAPRGSHSAAPAFSHLKTGCGEPGSSGEAGALPSI